MKTLFKNFKVYNKNDIEQIIFELKNNKAAIIETDTIMGMISLNEDLIYKLKKRSKGKRIIKFVDDLNSINNLTINEKKFLNKFWPGPITIIKDGISYRIPNDEFLLSIIKEFGSLYCSSANISNQHVIKTIFDANQIFEPLTNYYDLFLIDYNCKNKLDVESTIVSFDKKEIIRKGALYDEIINYKL